MSLDTLSQTEREATLDLLTAIGDDEYLYGDRLSSWLTIAPTLEEDNVLTSIAQDEMGHARLWFEIVADSRDITVDDLAIYRAAGRRRNSTLVERPYEDFADTVVRSFLYDHYERLLLEALEDGTHQTLTGRAGVALDEEIFHREHVTEWLDVFGTLTEARDRKRVRDAIISNLEHAGDLFSFPDSDRLLDCDVLGRAPEDLTSQWRETILPRLAGLSVGLDEEDLLDALEADTPDGRTGAHTPVLEEFVERIQPAQIEQLDQ
jgi:ring-1,2-phenylacetyl-CoA epoxidase subunit PaaC